MSMAQKWRIRHIDLIFHCHGRGTTHCCRHDGKHGNQNVFSSRSQTLTEIQVACIIHHLLQGSPVHCLGRILSFQCLMWSIKDLFLPVLDKGHHCGSLPVSSMVACIRVTAIAFPHYPWKYKQIFTLVLTVWWGHSIDLSEYCINRTRGLLLSV